MPGKNGQIVWKALTAVSVVLFALVSFISAYTFTTATSAQDCANQAESDVSLLNEKMNSHENSVAVQLEAVQDDVDEMKVSVKETHDKVERIDKQLYRQNIMIEAISDKWDIAIPENDDDE